MAGRHQMTMAATVAATSTTPVYGKVNANIAPVGFMGQFNGTAKALATSYTCTAPMP